MILLDFDLRTIALEADKPHYHAAIDAARARVEDAIERLPAREAAAYAVNEAERLTGDV